LTPGFSTITIIAIPSLTAFWGCPGQNGHTACSDLIPADGEPLKLVTKSSRTSRHAPVSKRQYSGWQELFDQLKAILSNSRDIAMQYSPNNWSSMSLLWTVAPSIWCAAWARTCQLCDLVALFEATLTEEQIKSHFAARDAIDRLPPPLSRRSDGVRETAEPTSAKYNNGFWKPFVARIW